METNVTPKQWWDKVELAKPKLVRLIERFYPSKDKKPEWVGEITAAAAEAACQLIRDQIDRAEPVKDFESAIVARDSAVVLTILSDTWFGMPESVACRSEPGFWDLCDLMEGPD